MFKIHVAIILYDFYEQQMKYYYNSDSFRHSEMQKKKKICVLFLYSETVFQRLLCVRGSSGVWEIALYEKKEKLLLERTLLLVQMIMTISKMIK